MKFFSFFHSSPLRKQSSVTPVLQRDTRKPEATPQQSLNPGQAWCRAQIHVSSQQTGLNYRASYSIRCGRKCGGVLLLSRGLCIYRVVWPLQWFVCVCMFAPHSTPHLLRDHKCSRDGYIGHQLLLRRPDLSHRMTMG